MKMRVINTVIKIGIFFIMYYPFFLSSQVQTLNHIGHSPGGAAHHVHWIEQQNILLVGCGASLWAYDMSDTQNPKVIKKRVFKQLINHTELYGDTLFVAATNEGVYALNFNSDSLDIIANYMPTGLWERDVFDFYRSNDTLYIPDKYEMKVVKYISGTFQHVAAHTNQILIGDNLLFKAGARTVDINDNYMVIGKIKDPLSQGRVSIYNRYYPYQRLAYWEDSTLNNIQQVQFADLRNDIIYVCAGSTNAGLTSHFYACHFNGTNIFPVDTFSIAGLPFFAAVNITNMTSRNDTVYLATTCWIDSANAIPGFPLSFIPVIDASKLPLQPMTYDTYYYAGLWHFDVELMSGTPYLAIASEWAGLVITDISNPNNHFDTLSVIETGGWVQEVKIRNDTVLVANEGWGLTAYKADSLLFANGGPSFNSKILHEYILMPGHYFVSGFEFIDDTLLYMSNGRVLNMKPWFAGGTPILLNTLNYNVPASKIENVYSNNENRLVIGSGLWPISELKITLHHPQTGQILDEILTYNEPKAYAIDDSIVFYSYRTTPYLQSGDVHLVAARINNNQFETISDIVVKSATIDVLTSIAIENNIIVVGCGATFTWYEFLNGNFIYMNEYTHSNVAMGTSGVDIKNNLIYGNYRYDGLKVIDLYGTELAYFEGSGGYNGIAGSGGSEVVVGNDGRIYVSDFYSGLFVVEAYDLTLNYQQPNLNDKINNDIFTVYPNPANKMITVNFHTGFESETTFLSIFDITGKELYSHQVSYDSFQINVGKWDKGLYFIKVISEGKYLKTEKIIIN